MQSSSKPKVGSLGKLGDARLDLVPALADCRPGIKPIEYNVIVAPVAATESDGKIGSLYIPDEAKETLDLAMQVGRIIAQSPLAYSYEKWADTSLQPQVGQIVWFARYAGKEFVGIDGKNYRILKDKDIGAIIEEPEAVQMGAAMAGVLVAKGDGVIEHGVFKVLTNPYGNEFAYVGLKNALPLDKEA